MFKALIDREDEVKLKYIAFTLIAISTLINWINFRNKIKNAENKEEIKSAFVPFLLSGILFILALIVFFFN